MNSLSAVAPADWTLASDLIAAGRILVALDVIDAFGHISARSLADPRNFLLIRNLAPALATVEDVQVFDLDANTDDERAPYLERFLHAETYRARPDVHSVVHSHSDAVIPFTTTTAALRPLVHMAAFLHPQAPVWDIRDHTGNGSDQLVRSPALGASLAASLGDAAVVLMRGHGSTTVGSSVSEAVFRAYYAEVNAAAQLASQPLGDAKFLTAEEAEAALRWHATQPRRAWEYWRTVHGTRSPLEVPAPAYDVSSFYLPGDWDSLYVEHWLPRANVRGRVVLVPGGGETGSFFTGRPDGGPGWAQELTRLGWELFIIDWPGTGRSGYAPEIHRLGATPIVEAVRALLRHVGPSTIIGHSIGGTIALKVADLEAALVTAIVGVNTGPAGNVHTMAPAMDESRAVFTPDERLTGMFATAERFPNEHFRNYAASRVQLSPRVYNQLGGRTGQDLTLNDLKAVRSVPILLVAAAGDHVVPESESIEQARLVAADLVVLERDWGLHGFGHLIPIERGSAEVITRIDAWLAQHAG